MKTVKKSAFFLSLTSGLYICYMVSAIYHEKILKSSYLNTLTGQQQYCKQSLIFTLLPPLIATLIGQAILAFTRQPQVLPWKKTLAPSTIINVNMFTYNQAISYASFPAIIMAKSCSLLSVIIVGVFCSRVKDKKVKLTYYKILIGLLATLGIVFFNYFKGEATGSDSQNNSLTLLSLGNLYLLISLIGDGFLPDFQAELKSAYKPSSIQMYTKINRTTFLICFLVSLCTLNIIDIVKVLTYYQGLLSDVLMLSILNSIGQLFVYRMLKQYQQHIPAFAIAFRKCLTVIVNMLWFHHSVNAYQIVGVLMVFGAVMMEVYSNYAENKRKAAQGGGKKEGEKGEKGDEGEKICSSQKLREGDGELSAREIVMSDNIQLRKMDEQIEQQQNQKVIQQNQSQTSQINSK